LRSADLSEDVTSQVLAECLASFPHVRLTVTGACMEPALPSGRIVRVRAAERRPPRWGDVVLVRQADGLRLHRLVWGPPVASAVGWWRTKADRGPALDARVRREDVLGTVVAVEGGRLARLGPTVTSLAGAIFARIRQFLRPR